jgi:hypothetical protein
MQRRKRATQILENELSNNEEENVEEENKSDNENELNNNSQKAIIDNHRDKSREIAQRIGEDNPNEVIDELHLVRDKIKDKIKQSLTDKLEKAREHDETASSEKIEQTKDKNEDLNLDLSSARYSNPSETLRESSLQRINRIKV